MFTSLSRTRPEVATLALIATLALSGSPARAESVGEAFGFPTVDGRAVRWHDSHAHDLNDFLAPGSGWVLRSAEGINEEGQIVGYGTFEGQTRAFLLTPGA